jgi:superfamily I DNA/RNA helicase
VAHLHKLLQAIAAIDISKEQAEDGKFWSHTLPEKAIELLIDTDEPSFDELIVDEAQDVGTDAFLDFLDLVLEGGLKSGRWKMFGDFNNQAIFEGTENSLSNIIARSQIQGPVLLTENCRNRPEIIEHLKTSTGLDLYGEVLRSPDSYFKNGIKFYQDAADQKKKLSELLERDIRDHYKIPYKDVIILSPRTQSVSTQMEGTKWDKRLVPLGNPLHPGQIPYSTIQGFKGLERRAVVVTDIEKLDTSSARELLYVAITRATDLIVIFASNPMRYIMLDMMLSQGVNHGSE